MNEKQKAEIISYGMGEYGASHMFTFKSDAHLFVASHLVNYPQILAVELSTVG